MQKEMEALVDDFKYLENTYHLDDEDGLMYKVSRVGKHRGYIVAWRQLVLTDGTLDKESKRPVHIKDVEKLTDLTGDTLSNNSPLLPIDVAYTDRAPVDGKTSTVHKMGGEHVRNALLSNLDAPSTDAQCDYKGHNKRSVEDIYD
jgi:hypothetical protein